MTFNPLEEKGIPLDKQLRNWEDIVKHPFNKTDVDCYSRTRQILMNGIEVEAWNFKHSFSRFCPDCDDCRTISQIRRIEDMQQTTVNWLGPEDQTVLETTLGYEQVAVDLTAHLAQNEPDPYVKETLDFGLLEDFDHLYRYAQWAYIMHGIDPNSILQEQTDCINGRPTQNHHNENWMRIRKPYDKNTALPQTKVNILTIVSAEQQTHNYYAEHGFMYGNNVLRQTYAEIKDVEEEHVSMYESLIDPTESIYEKLLLHEFTEVCNYYTCLEDETCPHGKKVWEMFLNFELEHLKIASEIFKKHEKRDPEEVIGNKIIMPNKFKSQKEYVKEILFSQVDKRLCGTKKQGYTFISELPSDWAGYNVQKKVNEMTSPSENTIRIIPHHCHRDIIRCDEELKERQVELIERGLEKKTLAPDTLKASEMQCIIDEYENRISKKEK